MQINYSELANETFGVNTKLINKSVELGVESAQRIFKGASEQSGAWLKVRTFDDLVETQENWNAFAVGQIQNSTRSAIELGTEAYNSYLSLWEKYSRSAGEAAVAATKAPVANKK
ncbi:MAG: hypothetical protein OXI60_05530 [Acidiferrobacterales bacterium]|nr:hypothetical protein [Acidiferrobacterales bacterium]